MASSWRSMYHRTLWRCYCWQIGGNYKLSIYLTIYFILQECVLSWDYNRIFQRELSVLTNPDLGNHPNLVKLIGYCCEDQGSHYGVVYDVRSKDSLLNLIEKGSRAHVDSINHDYEIKSLMSCLVEKLQMILLGSRECRWLSELLVCLSICMNGITWFAMFTLLMSFLIRLALALWSWILN